MSEPKPHRLIGARLAAFRQTQGMSAKDFAQEHGFNYTRYINWETGLRRIPIDEAAKLEERYGLSLDFIFLGRFSQLSTKLNKALSDSPLLK